jgi:glycosyltransferase involved in cell wall biosynthesis
MKFAFADFLAWDYKIDSAYQMALGGSQSALCYLAEALAKQGHEVFLLNHTSDPGLSRNVMCLSLEAVPKQLLQSLDALIVLNLAGRGIELRSLIGDNTRLILWTQHAHDQPAMQALHNPVERDVYDGFAFVSDWQRDRFHEHFGINLTDSGVLRNAIAPSFCGLFPSETPILPQKSQPPVLAYTSTPFRGLDLLLEVFPKIRSSIPGARLKVFSSMKVYQISQSEDESRYGSVYRQCRETEGVEYIGSLPQPELARELQSVMVLAYPNTFAETSCIAVMEAMASGCWIVTSDLGALPETTAEFARLVSSVEGDREVYKDRFVEETVQVLTKCIATDTTESETDLRRQVEYVNSSYTWSVRAEQWVQWLSSLGTETAVVGSQVPLVSIAASCADLQQQAYQYLIQCEYGQAVTLYEQAIKAYPSVSSSYWYLGLTFLLQGQDVEAQTTWMLAIVNREPEQVDVWKAELLQVLREEAQRREALVDYQTVELIQQYIAELTSDMS